MKEFRWDRNSIRGAIYSIIGCLGIIYEIFFRSQFEWLIIVIYTFVIGFGTYIAFFYKSPE